jgi:hypothetical protein
MVVVRLTDPMFNGDVYAYLAGSLPARVREQRNVLTVEFTDGRDLTEQVEAVRRITKAWRAAGHFDVGTDVKAA